MDEHLKITPIQIILSYQAQPQTNNLDKLENHNTPPHKYEYQSPPRNPINPTSRTHTLIITENIRRHIYINYQTPPPQNSSQDPRRILESLAKKNPKIMMITTTRKSGPSGDVRGEGESSTTESQDPTDGSYIISTESCNI